jgi:hypothetical protein
MSTSITLTKTDNRPVEVNLDRANIVLRDDRNYGTLIAFGASDSVTVLETPDEIFGRAPKRERARPAATTSI